MTLGPDEGIIAIWVTAIGISLFLLSLVIKDSFLKKMRFGFLVFAIMGVALLTRHPEMFDFLSFLR